MQAVFVAILNAVDHVCINLALDLDAGPAVPAIHAVRLCGLELAFVVDKAQISGG